MTEDTIGKTARRRSRPVKVGGVVIGGESPVSIQSMTNTDSRDFGSTFSQMCALREAGCDIVRMTVPDAESARVLGRLKKSGVGIPVVADIHFDWKLAIAAIEEGADKVRINPGNIGDESRVREIARAAADRGIPVRVGINGGSLEKRLLEKYGGPVPEALAESALENADMLLRNGLEDIVVSIKSSSVANMIAANRILAERCDLPLHLGVTEAGTAYSGTVKNAVGIGALLCDGIGDTVRVSLTADPVEEIRAAREILKACGCLRTGGLNVISCPTCGRTRIDIIGIAGRFEERAKAEKLDGISAKVAIMGCAVNGPGEAREADFGIAGGNGDAVFFRNGAIEKKISEDSIVDVLMEELRNFGNKLPV